MAVKSLLMQQKSLNHGKYKMSGKYPDNFLLVKTMPSKQPGSVKVGATK